MRTLLLTPEAPGFTCQPRARAYAILLDSPTAQYHALEPVQAWDVAASWLLLGGEYDYFMAFWRTVTARNAKRFLLELPIERGEMVQCICAFTAAPKLTEVNGPMRTVQASLEAMVAQRSAFHGSSRDATLVAELQA